MLADIDDYTIDWTTLSDRVTWRWDEIHANDGTRSISPSCFKTTNISFRSKPKNKITTRKGIFLFKKKNAFLFQGSCIIYQYLWMYLWMYQIAFWCLQSFRCPVDGGFYEREAAALRSPLRPPCLVALLVAVVSGQGLGLHRFNPCETY